MHCLAIFQSGNYAFRLCTILERKGYVFEVVSVPCQIAKDGCGYCLRFPVEFKDLVLMEGYNNSIAVKEIYKVIPTYTKNKYEKIY